MKPVSELIQLDFRGILNIKDYGMDTVGIAYEVVIDHVIRFDAWKFPNAEFASLTEIALKKKRRKTWDWLLIHKGAQCENSVIFLPLRFYVKSILAILQIYVDTR